MPDKKDGKKPDVVVKKVSPYPVPMQITLGAQVFQCQIIKLTLFGFLADLKGAVVTTAKEYDVRFVLPVFNVEIAARVKVIKTYDRFVPGQAAATPATEAAPPPGTPPPSGNKKGLGHVQRIAEMHFVQISTAARASVEKFLTTIQQTGKL